MPPDAVEGRLLFAYRPPRAHPILYAGAIVLGLVFLTGSAENALRDGRPILYAAYALPLVLDLALFALLVPSETRVHEHGIAPSRPLLLRWHRPFVRWEDLRAVYPSFYDVTGAFVSPFASSDGKVTQMGLALEGHDGHVETVRFTPTRFVAWQHRSRGFNGALEVVRERFERLGRPMTPPGEAFTPEESGAMVAQASRPFLPFFAIVFLFAAAAPVLAVLVWLGLDVGPALAIALLLPLGVSLRSFVQSRKRHAILNRLSRAAEGARGREDA